MPETEVVRLKNLTSVDFVSFFEHAQGSGSCDKFELVVRDKSNEFFTERFPPCYTEFLVSLDAKAIKRHCTSYAKSEDNKWGPDAKNWADIIKNVQALAKKAKDSGTGLYLWNCI